jgi:acetyl-CoA/propionyl-CoA carboxylase biotin carboxyl carrier protein
VFTTWIESDFAATVAGLGRGGAAFDAAGEQATERVIVEVGGKRLEVVLPAALAQAGRANARATGPTRRGARRSAGATRSNTGTALSSPMQGTIVKVAVVEGAMVAEGDLVVVLEAMKMERPLTAHRAGIVRGFALEVGAGVSAGTIICDIADAE